MRGATAILTISRPLAGVSIHAPHARGDWKPSDNPIRNLQFQSTPLMRGATFSQVWQCCSGIVSIHAPHARGDMAASLYSTCGSLFQSTPLMRGATWIASQCDKISMFQSTPLMRGATSLQYPAAARQVVSIHAPHARGDIASISGGGASSGFNPRPSCEGRQDVKEIDEYQLQFQSTPLMRGATIVPNPVKSIVIVSIHAPHARGDRQDCRQLPP